MADIFVSYTSSDREWAHWIALELQRLGHVARVHEWEIEGSESIYAWMEKRTDAADRVLCVVSDEYLKAPYSTLERHAALWQAASKRPGFVLLVAVRPCKFPTLSDHLRRCELFGLPESAARSRFRQFMEAPVKPESVPFPGKVLALSNIPIRVPEHFLGRDDALAEIASALKRGEGRVAITTLHGMRGVGKTVLAAAYAERHKAAYRATWWVRAETPDTSRADLVSLGVRLSWVSADEKEEPALEKVRARLRDEGDGLLLIYDNAIDAASVRAFLPASGAAQVLLTSNAHAWRSLATPVEIRVWPKDVGADFLGARAGRAAEHPEAEALSEELGGLPLAHEQSAAYCERLDVTFAEYRRRFERAPAPLLNVGKDASVDYHSGLTVAKTFALAIDEVAKLHPAAEPLITYAALVAPEPIPLFLFSEPRDKFGEPLASQFADEGLDEAVAVLRAFALVDRETVTDERDPSISTEAIRLHRLVRVVAAGRRQDAAKELARRILIEAAASVFPLGVHNDPRTWPRARRLDAIALALVGGPVPPPLGAEKSASFLLDRLASYRQAALAAYSEARELYERAITIAEAGLDPDVRELAVRLHNLANLIMTLGDPAGARPLYERALAINEKAFGRDHPVVANTLNDLGELLRTMGDLAGARALHERALAIREKALGRDDPLLAVSLNNFGRLFIEQGDFAEAMSLYERAIAINEKAFGQDHASTAFSIDNLSSVHFYQGDLAAARPLYERALVIREKAVGPEHPETAATLNNLAALIARQGDLAGGRLLYERALAIRETALGPGHSTTNSTRLNLAGVLIDDGEPGKALSMAELALAAFQTALGIDHAWTKESGRVKATALEALGRTDEATAVRAQYGVGGGPP